jgi:hypothetical protein
MSRYTERQRNIDVAQRSLIIAAAALTDNTQRDFLTLAVMHTALALHRLANADDDGKAAKQVIAACREVK